MPSAIDLGHDGMAGPTTTPSRRASLKILSRNIGQVVLGNMLFDTWYYSPYPDAIILSSSHHSSKAIGHAEGRNGNGFNTLVHSGEKVACPRLYVCPFCFCYFPELEGYVQHLEYHRGLLQQELKTNHVPDSAFKVYEWDGYAVWEVDGEREKLYCQNLSLFGKLFLEQKSVFFDTGGFKYYVLTHTSPESTSPPRRGRGRKRSSSILEDDPLFKTNVMGFFSKESLSWDSNNLACILIFPPFQHRQLGQLLMSVSYKLSGWEWEGGVIGGPEKPLSAMGRKSYSRFWSERIARFMMGQTADADARRVFDKSRKKKIHLSKEEMTVKELGDKTGMLAEDVVAALNEMEICDVRPTKRKKKNSSEANGASASMTDRHEDHQVAAMTVSRSKVLAWAEAHKVDIVSPVKEEGFLGEWALSDIDDQRGDDDREGSDEVESN